MIVLMKCKKSLEDGGEDVNSYKQDTLMYYISIDMVKTDVNIAQYSETFMNDFFF